MGKVKGPKEASYQVHNTLSMEGLLCSIRKEQQNGKTQKRYTFRFYDSRNRINYVLMFYDLQDLQLAFEKSVESCMQDLIDSIFIKYAAQYYISTYRDQSPLS